MGLTGVCRRERRQSRARGQDHGGQLQVFIIHEKCIRIQTQALVEPLALYAQLKVLHILGAEGADRGRAVGPRVKAAPAETARPGEIGHDVVTPLIGETGHRRDAMRLLGLGRWREEKIDLIAKYPGLQNVLLIAGPADTRRERDPLGHIRNGVQEDTQLLRGLFINAVNVRG